MPTKEKDQVLEAINHLGRRVTVADVATKTGLPLNIVNSQLNTIASETGGDLQVATTGDIAYCFSPGFQTAYLATGVKRVLQQVGSAVFRAAFFVLKISFGIMLIVSLITIVILIFVVMNAMQRGNSDDDRGSGPNFDFHFNFFDYLILRDLLWWGTWSTVGDSHTLDNPYVKKRAKSNFLMDCFSFLFGDGNPNAHIEERRWQMTAQAIKRNNGVITSEQLAPYTGVNPKNEYGVFPVLVRFDGRPEVTDNGNIVYVFPSMQVSAAGQSSFEPVDTNDEKAHFSSRFRPAATGQPHPFLNEFPWKFTNSSESSMIMVSVLAGVNFFGAWWLFSQLYSPAVAIALQPLAPLIYALVIYGTLFVALPIGRWLVLKVLNSRIENRNVERSKYAENLLSPSQELSLKLNEAQGFKVKEHTISQDKVVYTTEKESLEQEFEN